MVTARSLFGIRRARPHTGVARLLWLGALLLALVYAHGLGVEGGSGHVSANTVTWSSAQLAEGGETGEAQAHDAGGADEMSDAEAHRIPHEHQDAPHPGGECLSGKPQDDLMAGGPCSLERGAVPVAGGHPPTAPGSAHAELNALTPEHPHRITNLRI